MLPWFPFFWSPEHFRQGGLFPVPERDRERCVKGAGSVTKPRQSIHNICTYYGQETHKHTWGFFIFFGFQLLSERFACGVAFPFLFHTAWRRIVVVVLGLNVFRGFLPCHDSKNYYWFITKHCNHKWVGRWTLLYRLIPFKQAFSDYTIACNSRLD